MTTFYLIRHAENDWIGKRLPGWMPGIHLNAQGQMQAEALAAVLAGVRFRAIYSSPLERARETAAPLARARHLRVVTRAALGEVRAGEWEGVSLRSLRRRKLWPLIQRAPSLARFPGGESFVEVQSRLIQELERLRRLHPRATLACVSHADVVRLAIAHYLGLPLDLFHRLTVAPASISVLRVEPEGARLLCLNDTRALERAPRG
ncbi:MAG: histidine phosphatase family protein [Chloroflexota bacterium]